jgi:hypothetical protein
MRESPAEEKEGNLRGPFEAWIARLDCTMMARAMKGSERLFPWRLWKRPTAGRTQHPGRSNDGHPVSLCTHAARSVRAFGIQLAPTQESGNLASREAQWKQVARRRLSADATA